MTIKFLHTMVRVSNLEESLNFYCNALGLRQVKRKDVPEGKFSLIFLTPPNNENFQIELTYNWSSENYDSGRNFGHIAFEVDNIYEVCKRLLEHGIVINRPPKDGRMAFIKSPDNISIELLQKNEPLEPIEPWASMENTGIW